MTIDTKKQTSTIEVIKIPDLGVSTTVNVIEILVKVGEKITIDYPVVTLEGEKASVDVPSPKEGIVKKILLTEGSQVMSGDDLLELEVTEAPQEKAVKPVENIVSETQVNPPKEIGVKETRVVVSSDLHASPSVRRISREFGVDLSKVVATGRKGRISMEDVQNYVKKRLQEGPALTTLDASKYDFSKYGDFEFKKLSKIKKFSGEHLYKTWVTVPHITHFDEVDITALEEFRQQKKKENIRITPLAFVIKAVVKCLKEFPLVNSSLDFVNKKIIAKKYYNIGIAVDTPDGLIVPVIKEADHKDVFAISKDLIALSKRAKEGKLKQTEIEGQSFTISSLGGIGGTAFTPIVNFPDVAILGLSKMAIKPVYIKDQFVPRKILPFCVAYDHRILDGAEVARFSLKLSEYLQDFNSLI